MVITVYRRPEPNRTWRNRSPRADGRDNRQGSGATDVESVNYTLSLREPTSNNLPNPLSFPLSLYPREPQVPQELLTMCFGDASFYGWLLN